MPSDNDFIVYNMLSAPSFNLTLAEFTDLFNQLSPHLLLPDFELIEHDAEINLAYLASKINHFFYSSIVVDQRTDKIKTVQFTYLPVPVQDTVNISPDEDNLTRETLAIHYISTLIRCFNPTISEEQCTEQAYLIVHHGSQLNFLQQTTETLRYVVADHGENGLTFSIEPIKQK